MEKKESAAKPIGRLVHYDLFKSDKKQFHLCAESSNAPWFRSLSSDEFVFCFVLITSRKPHLHCAMYFAIALDESAPWHDLYAKFLKGDDDSYRTSRFKLIPKLVEGPLVIRSVVGSKPALLAQKIKFQWHKSARYLEADADIGTSAVAGTIAGMCQSYARAFSIELGILCEGRDPSELPEALIGCVLIDHLDIKSVRELECNYWLGTGLGLGFFPL